MFLNNKVENLFGSLYDGSIYSGYLNTKIEGNQLFYIYSPSQSVPESDPLMLWLNGGPGCSSLFGMLAEIGPVISGNFEAKFKLNPYSWNKNANLLFIEQPAGVGFSKTSNPRYLWRNDDTADNLLAAVKDFFTVLPNLKGRSFYISGESYAGVYIPTLATYILNDHLTLKTILGIILGCSHLFLFRYLFLYGFLFTLIGFSSTFISSSFSSSFLRLGGF